MSIAFIYFYLMTSSITSLTPLNDFVEVGGYCWFQTFCPLTYLLTLAICRGAFAPKKLEKDFWSNKIFWLEKILFRKFVRQKMLSYKMLVGKKKFGKFFGWKSNFGGKNILVGNFVGGKIVLVGKKNLSEIFVRNCFGQNLFYLPTQVATMFCL
jgi:hypothetical protein